MAAFEYIDLATVNFTPELLGCVPATIARRYQVLPIIEVSSHMVIALSDPSDLELIDLLFGQLRRDLQVIQADQHQIERMIHQHYGDE